MVVMVVMVMRVARRAWKRRRNHVWFHFKIEMKP
jgi:hypothetical protein